MNSTLRDDVKNLDTLYSRAEHSKGCATNGDNECNCGIDTAFAELKASIEANDQIYRMYQRIMAVVPQCPDHGQCVPYAEFQLTHKVAQ